MMLAKFASSLSVLSLLELISFTQSEINRSTYCILNPHITTIGLWAPSKADRRVQLTQLKLSYQKSHSKPKVIHLFHAGNMAVATPDSAISQSNIDPGSLNKSSLYPIGSEHQFL